MSLQNVRLPNSLITEMYRSTVVTDLSSSSANPAKGSAELIPYLGKNAKGIAVVVAGVKKFVETASEIQFLLKVLKACNLTLDDIALVDQKHASGSLHELNLHPKPSKILLFSADLEGVSISEDLYFQIKIEQGIQRICAPLLSSLIPEDAGAVKLKKKLWQVLKTFFDV